MHNASRSQVRRRALGERRVRLATICAATVGTLLTTGLGFQFAQIEAAAAVAKAAVGHSSAEISVPFDPASNASTENGVESTGEPAPKPAAAPAGKPTEQPAPTPTRKAGKTTTRPAAPSSSAAAARDSADEDSDDEDSADEDSDRGSSDGESSDELTPPADPPKKASAESKSDASSGAS